MNSASKYPGFSSRMLAFNIDLAILIPFLWILGAFVNNNKFLILLCYLLYVFYNFFFEIGKWQATPGKKIQKMKVSNLFNRKLTAKNSLIRNTLKIASCFPPFLGILMIHFNKKRQAFHDRITESVVTF